MRKIGLLVLVMMVCAACHLSPQSAVQPEPTYTPRVTPSANVPPTVTPLAFGDGSHPTLPPPPGVGILPSTNIPVTSAPALNSMCQVYTTYSGNDPLNKISLRQTPSANALQVLRLPNNATVMLVPGSQEVAAEDYHWLNVIYVDSSQIRYTGWIARDSYFVNGVHDPTIATLRATGTQSPC